MERLHADLGAGRKFTDLQARFRLHLPRKTSQAQVAGKTGCFACPLVADGWRERCNSEFTVPLAE
jgi:hypothetical protein